MHQTMCKRKISKVNVQTLQVVGMLISNILQLYLLISSSLFVYDLPESHPRPLLLFWVADFLPSIPQLLFCWLMLSQLLRQYVISLDFTQTGKVMISCYIWYQVCSFCWLWYQWQIKDINNQQVCRLPNTSMSTSKKNL